MCVLLGTFCVLLYLFNYINLGCLGCLLEDFNSCSESPRVHTFKWKCSNENQQNHWGVEFCLVLLEGLRDKSLSFAQRTTWLVYSTALLPRTCSLVHPRKAHGPTLFSRQEYKALQMISL